MLTSLRSFGDGIAADKSLASLAGALYYSMAEARQRRGDNPLAEAESHAGHESPSPHAYDALFELAPFALYAVYEETLVDMQRHGSHLGYSLLFGATESDVGRPAFAVYAKRHSATPAGAGAASGGGGGETKDGETRAADAAAADAAGANAAASPASAGVVVVAVRGTNQMTDAIVDARAEGVPFETDDGSLHGWAHRGIAEAAHWLLAQVLIPLRQMAAEGYTVKLCGHSLGGGVASVLTVLLRPLIPSVSCIGFATPPVLAGDELLAATSGFITAVVLRRDAISRCTIASVRELLQRLAAYDSARTWRHSFRHDSLGFLHRAAQQLCGESPIRPVHLVRALPAPQLRGADHGEAANAVRLAVAPRPDGGVTLSIEPLVVPQQAEEEEKVAGAEEGATVAAVAEAVVEAVAEEAEAKAAATAEQAVATEVGASEVEPSATATSLVTSAADPPASALASIPTSALAATPTPAAEADSPQLHVPGRVLHLYYVHGAYRAAWLPEGGASAYPPLQSIELAPHMLSDHRGASYLSALKSARASSLAPLQPPRWVPFREAGDTCACCHAPFTWEQTEPDSPTLAQNASALRRSSNPAMPISAAAARNSYSPSPTPPAEAPLAAEQSTGKTSEGGGGKEGASDGGGGGRGIGGADNERSAAQQACTRHHCRACGRVVCDACSRRQQCLPQFGIIEQARVCDACFFS